MALSISRRILSSLDSVLASGHVSKGESVFRACRNLSGSVLNHESSGGAIFSNSLSPKPVVASVTKFPDEKEGSATSAGDILDTPVTMDAARRIFFCSHRIHPVVLWQLAKRKQGIRSTKTSAILRKPWNQKDNSLASHGILSDPQLRGGSTVHGPKPQSHTTKNIERLAQKVALTSRAAQGKVLVFEDFGIYRNKPKNIVNYIKQRRKKEKTKKILLVDGGPISEKLKIATRNLRYVTLIPLSDLDVDTILYFDRIVMSRDAINKIAEQIMYTPINHGCSMTYW